MDSRENSDSDSDMGVDETSDIPMEVNNTQDSSVQRIGRGAVQCKRITKMREGELLNVQYNEDGQRIGEGGKDLASYSGLLVDSRISIVDYENQHAVGDEAKFNLTEDEKKGVVSDIDEKWKEFKNYAHLSIFCGYFLDQGLDKQVVICVACHFQYQPLNKGLELLIVRRTIKPRESGLMMLAFVTSWLPIPLESLSNGLHSFRPDGPKRKRVFVKVVKALVDVEGMGTSSDVMRKALAYAYCLPMILLPVPMKSRALPFSEETVSLAFPH
ncbi:hypothetical protein IFM89_001930 [Coptis chinensis]|uniref:Uncharacterized protein n=1 Tax=Coptis chinensis TaxID=261450 RepID=A0A835HND2_9MAGN|nr:hypothetical protein IFM89_001930 [Coptis chinensis]